MSDTALRRRVGVTATRHPLVPEQFEWLSRRLGDLYVPGAELHHGDCVNGDAQAHTVGHALGYRIFVHPPLQTRWRAYTVGDVTLEPRDFIVRNRAIVDLSSVLLAVPDGPEIIRSGTWSTVRYARRVGCEVRNWWDERTT